MRISNQTPTYQPAAQTRRSSSGSGAFGKQLDIAALRNTDRFETNSLTAKQTIDELKPSAYLTLMYSYDAWKEKQPPKDLPDSWGPTEENLAFLKDHYSGDLSWEERVDALKTMRQLGVITEEQEDKAMGVKCTRGTLEEIMPILKEQVKYAMKEDLAYLRGGWDACFQDRPIGSFKTADDLFSWLDNLLESES